MTAPKPTPAATIRSSAIMPVFISARRILADYAISGWILAELAYVLALYLFAFRYPFDAPYFFETANWGLSLLAVGATALLVARAMRSAAYRPAIAHAPRQTYIAGLMLAAVAVRGAICIWLLALALLSRNLLSATPGTLLAGMLGLIANGIVLAALTLALSTAFAPRLARLATLAWLVGALYSYAATNTLADFFLTWRLPLLPIFAGFAMGLTGRVDGGGLLALAVDAVYVVVLVRLADVWRARLEAPQATDEAQAAWPRKPAAAPPASRDERLAPPRTAQPEQRQTAKDQPAAPTAPRYKRPPDHSSNRRRTAR